MPALPTEGLSFDIGTVSLIAIGLVGIGIPVAVYLIMTVRKYKKLILPLQFKLSAEIFERRGKSAFGQRRVTKAFKFTSDEMQNIWILSDTGEWIEAPPFEYLIHGSHAKFWMNERGSYIPIMPDVNDVTKGWTGFLSERQKEAAFTNLKKNRDYIYKKNVWMEYAPVILSVITIVVILVFILVVGGALGNVADQFKIAAQALASAGTSCSGGAVAPPINAPAPPIG